ncbi:MAG: hypothetical protein B7Z19_04065 [Polynucleobacter sp. 32-46-5]|nr:MAG: hypothetical protein B7Z19_04065 [Polynucleobacter sp. 32-46-5]
MQSSNIPSKIPLPFAYAAGSGYVNPIPAASQIGITNGRASLHDGFPPLTFTPIGAGGVPPFGSDMNGILNEVTAIQQWQEAGGHFPFDAAFASTIGGYPKGAILASATLTVLWQSTIENNSNNPDTGGAGWVPLTYFGANVQNITGLGSTITLSTNDAAYPVLAFTGSLSANTTIIVPSWGRLWTIYNSTSGAYTLTIKTATGTGVPVPQGSSSLVFSETVNVYYADSAKVASFNGRTGSVSLNATDVVNALGYTPINPNQFIQSFGSAGYQILLFDALSGSGYA